MENTFELEKNYILEYEEMKLPKKAISKVHVRKDKYFLVPALAGYFYFNKNKIK